MRENIATVVYFCWLACGFIAFISTFCVLFALMFKFGKWFPEIAYLEWWGLLGLLILLPVWWNLDKEKRLHK